MSEVQDFIRETVTENPVVLFMKGTAQAPRCGFSASTVQNLRAVGLSQVVIVNVLDDAEVRQGIKDYSNWPTIPQLYIKGECVGGSDIVSEMYENGELEAMLREAGALE
ncbi:Grx4 family monothiol glutaredoxin [Alcaligenes sp. Marseille-Q7550]